MVCIRLKHPVRPSRRLFSRTSRNRSVFRIAIASTDPAAASTAFWLSVGGAAETWQAYQAHGPPRGHQRKARLVFERGPLALVVLAASRLEEIVGQPLPARIDRVLLGAGGANQRLPVPSDTHHDPPVVASEHLRQEANQVVVDGGHVQRASQRAAKGDEALELGGPGLRLANFSRGGQGLRMGLVAAALCVQDQDDGEDDEARDEIQAPGLLDVARGLDEPGEGFREHDENGRSEACDQHQVVAAVEFHDAPELNAAGLDGVVEDRDRNHARHVIRSREVAGDPCSLRSCLCY